MTTGFYEFRMPIPVGSKRPRATLEVMDAIKRISLQEGTARDAKIFYDWIQMECCGLLEPSFTTDNGGLTAFNEGRRFVALLIREATNADTKHLEQIKKGE